MTFNQFAIRNTLRNSRLYLAYFLSTAFSVMIFFTFSVFVFHPQLSQGNLNTNVQAGMKIAAVIIYIFSFFFVLYSMDVFLQSRKKEFGTLMIQGMSPKQLRKMVVVENMVIGALATIAGSLVGILFSQLTLWIAKFFIGISFAFYFPVAAIGLTIVSFLLLFLVISFFIQFKLPKLNVQELLKASELGKGVIKVSVVKAILGLAMIVIGYVLATMSQNVYTILAVFVPVLLLVIIGTKLFYDQFSVMVIERIRQNKSLFWKKTNMIVFSDLSFRMKDNARSFFLVTIISTVAFAAIGTLFGLYSMLHVGFADVYYDFQGTNLSAQVITKTEDYLHEYHIDTNKVTYERNNVGNRTYISESDFNRQAKLLKLQTVKTHGNVIQLMSSARTSRGNVIKNTETVGGKKYRVTDHLYKGGLAVSNLTFVIPDSLIPANAEKSTVTIWQAVDQGQASEQAQIKASDKIGPLGINCRAGGEAFILNYYAPILFVGLFVGIVFFVAAGSFLYFRLYSDMNNDIEKFRMIYKLGLSKKELKKMINQQIGILFFTPIIVSVLHGVIALNTMYHAFNTSIQKESFMVLGIFIVIQVCYYLLCRTFYFKKVYHEITA